ncbi:hypothetical protein M9Y10_015523 [Tritrichomonas musculus]|uniref:F5/8 type C domain-containing protein n=1 Tax=Tritrichomonas musculus TaxID=1915356 RepID=A0ABR2L2I2_9EUKA
MIEYLIENLDDEIVSNEIPKITNLIRWILEKKNNKNFFNNGKVTECHFSSDELNGIVSYMKKTFGNDLDENGSLKLSGGGSPNQSFPLSNLIQYDKFQINDFYSKDSSQKPSSESADSWIEFDFVDRRINLTSYTMRAYANGKNSFYNPKSWRIVGSNDRKEWTVLDHEEDCSALNGSCKQNRFACDENGGYYRYIRYIQDYSWNISSKLNRN